MKKVALIGKPNVGKSSLFNCLIDKNKAIVDDQPGVTRDRNYAFCEWVGRKFQLIDTGGILNNLDLPFQEVVNTQVNLAIKEAEVILFLVSYKDGLTNDDYYVAKLLKKNFANKKIILVVNKAENCHEQEINKFYNLKFGNFFLVSAAHRMGIGDLLDAIIKRINLPSSPLKYEEENYKFCIIGKTNVGKSSLVNAILNDNRVIVSNQVNTTRDSIDCEFKYHQKKYTIIDTAGIRRKGKMSLDIDKNCYLQTKQAIARSELIIIMLDGSEEMSEQDKTISGLTYDANIPTMIVVNKWDKVKKETKTMNDFIRKIRVNFAHLIWAPIVFISALKKQRIETIFKTMDQIKQQLKLQVKSKLLNDLLKKVQIVNPPPKFKGGRINIYYATQVKSKIPTFVLFTNNPKYLHFSYSRYLENQIRQAFGLNIVPLCLYFKDKNSRVR